MWSERVALFGANEWLHIKGNIIESEFVHMELLDTLKNVICFVTSSGALTIFVVINTIDANNLVR